jgi:hypothetical protein
MSYKPDIRSELNIHPFLIKIRIKADFSYAGIFEQSAELPAVWRSLQCTSLCLQQHCKNCTEAAGYL